MLTIERTTNDIVTQINTIGRSTAEAMNTQHSELLSRLDRIPLIEETLERLRNQPTPNAFFTPAIQAIIQEHLGLDVNNMNFRDRFNEDMRTTIRFNPNNVNLYSLTIAARMLTRSQLASYCGPVQVRGNEKLPLPEVVTNTIKGKQTTLSKIFSLSFSGGESYIKRPMLHWAFFLYFKVE